MNSSWRNIALTFIGTSNQEEITVERIAEKMDEFPYFSPLPFIKTLLLQKKGSDKAVETASLASIYFSNPLWFSAQLKLADQEPSLSARSTINPSPIETIPASSSELSFEPLHTVDYFASQGIKSPVLTQKNDQLSVKLKSFTEWLKTMKKIHPDEIKPTIDQSEEQKIREKAEASNIVKEVYSETLAEVYIQQGLTQKAIEVYEKLSLLDPSKSAYFATRINEFKRN